MTGDRKNKFNKNSKAGFTFVELLVSIAVFSTMVAVVASIFLSTVGSQRKNIGQQDVLDNARYVLENLGRSIRQSSILYPSGSGETSSITINHPDLGVVTYDLIDNQIVEVIGSGGPVALSSSNVYVSSLNFNVYGNNSGDNRQPIVTISISLRSLNNRQDENSDINIQTSITPRLLQY